MTVRSGLARTGTDLALASDVVFRFETEGEAATGPRVVVGRDVIEAGPGEVPVIAARAILPDTEDDPIPAPKTADVRVYRLPSLDRAVDVLADFLVAPRWTEFTDPLMPTDGLPAVASFTAPLESVEGDMLILRFPEALDEGWYIVEIQGTRPSQAFLQVTPVSAWVSVASDQTVVWVNDVQTHRALRGATVAVGAAAPFARSDADGLAIGPTPDTLVPPAAAGDESPPPSPILWVTSGGGDVVLVPFDVRGFGESYRGEWSEKTEPADESFWAMLYTDRDLYRRTDTIEVWGYLRGRDDGRVPASVDLRLVPNAAENDADAPAVIAVTATPGSDGAFTASLPVVSLPLDSYRVQAVVDDRVAVSRWVTVSIIRKPPYQLGMTTNHQAVIVGSKVTWTSAATFFDGTPVASLDLVLSGGGMGDERRATTNAEGEAAVTVTATRDSDDGDAWEDPSNWVADVRPAGPESAEIWANHAILTFPSALDLRASGVVTDGKLRVTGTLSTVDLAQVEAELAAGSWDGDAAGDPVRGQALRAKITELIPVRRQVGSEYDFIEKVVRPIYEYDVERKAFRTLSVESAAGGKISFSVAVPDPDHQYEVVLTTRDKADRLAQRTLHAGQPAAVWSGQLGVYFETTDGLSVDDASFGVGDEIEWRMVDQGAALPSGEANRYLYLVSQRGLRSAVVTDAATFRRTFAPADAPGVFVIGVRFSGTTYAPKASAWAMFDPDEREILVRVTPDRERYRPGETATLAVETTRPNGSPVAATVVLQAVDEKLFAMGGATVPDPLADLYRRVDSGIVRLTATHQTPNRSGSEGEGGDTTGGGGDRSDFKDTLLFREIRTDAAGKGSVTVRLSDDLTSWHVIASAVTADLAAGVAERLVPVGLPFFVELTVADQYLLTDRPELQVRAFGDALRSGDAITFTVASPSLGLSETTVEGTAYMPVSIALPALSLGSGSVTVSATVPGRKDGAGRPLTDALTRTFDVVGSRFTASETAYGVVADGLPSVPKGAERSTWTFADAGRGKLVPTLSSLAMPAGLRLDRALAQSIARDLLIQEFGRDPASLPGGDFDATRYPIGSSELEDGTVIAGAGLLPYASVDPWLATRIAMLAPESFDRQTLLEVLIEIRSMPTTKRDLAIAATAGLAAIGEPVLGDLQEVRREADLTPAELIDLALGFAAAGDDASARAIERDLLRGYGERLGPWVRLRLDPTPGGADPTALVAVVAAGVGDPLADGLADYAITHAAVDSVNALELAAYASVSLERTPSAAAAFAYTVEGTRTVIELGAGESLNLVLTPAQAAGLVVENLSGRVGVAVDARVPVAPSSLRPHADVTLTRTLPDQPIPTVGLVTVDLRATFDEAAPEGCYDVVELVPSGLAPLSIVASEEDEATVTWPSSVVGQEVRFCAENSAQSGHSAHLRYLARVVNEGAFAWEPAVLQLSAAPELLAITPAGTARIEAR
ncbi:MAG TPA: alpha-2-macroglobulin family protein [Candidatus Limnocylindrales bacterium]|nr:alpha-2-macroglobulin family protein [Candidatus Limnocylindrales bacterium]